jgi:NAD(P)-dependent dehydrogenase (short-subunit alcohol dehydrogenase family)
MRASPEPPTVLITGATSGIGYHTAIGLGRQGAHVLITGRDENRGEQAVTTIRSIAGHDRVEFHPADHSTILGNRQLGARVDTALAEQGGQLDVLINNVGRVFSTRQETTDGIEQTLALCLIGPVSLTETLLPTLRLSPRPRIVNVVSSAYKMWKGDPFADLQSERDYVGLQVHARAKLLNLIWSFALAAELDHACSVNATNPGVAWTDGTASLTPEAVPAWRHIWPIVRFFQRRASAEKAARTPIWLASNSDAAALTGYYVEKRKRQRPAIATDPANQKRTIETVHALIHETSLTRPASPASELAASHRWVSSPHDTTRSLRCHLAGSATTNDAPTIVRRNDPT